MKKITMIVASLFIFLTACEDYLDVNKNIDAPDYVEGYLYLAGIQQSYFGVYYEIRGLGPMTQMMGTTTSAYTNFANHYYAQGSDACGEIWRMTYWNQGMNLENMINQSFDKIQTNYTSKYIMFSAKTTERSTMDFKQLEAFVNIVKHKSFSKAAKTT